MTAVTIENTEAVEKVHKKTRSFVANTWANSFWGSTLPKLLSQKFQRSKTFLKGVT